MIKYDINIERNQSFQYNLYPSRQLNDSVNRYPVNIFGKNLDLNTETVRKIYVYDNIIYLRMLTRKTNINVFLEPPLTSNIS